MARKKKKEETIEEIIHEPEVKGLALTRVEMLELENLNLGIENANLSAEIETLKRNNYLSKIDPEGKVLEFSRKIQTEAYKVSKTKGELEALKKRIEERLGISSLSDYSYDDNTGELIKPDK